MHVNIPPPRPQERLKNDDGMLQGVKVSDEEELKSSFNWKKVKWVMIGLIMPEFITAIAFTQWWEQRSLLSYINEKTELSSNRKRHIGAQSDSVGDVEMAATTGYDSSTAPAEDEQERRKVRQPSPWTHLHSWYALMGGYVVEDTADDDFKFPFPNGLTRLTLTTNAVRLLARDDPNVFPQITNSEILDKSKSNGLAKLIVCLQALWFCVCVGGRLVQRLPLTVLELNTAAHCICTLLCYMFWWNKPFDIVEPTKILLTEGHARQRIAQMCVESSVGRYADREESVYAKGSVFLRTYSNIANRHFNTGWDRLHEEDLAVIHCNHGSDPLIVVRGEARRPSRQIEVYHARAIVGRDLPTEFLEIEAVGIRDLVALVDLYRLADLRTGQPDAAAFLHPSFAERSDYEPDWVVKTAPNGPGMAELTELLGTSGWTFLATCVVYAGVHSTAWNGPFGSRPELYLWRAGVLSFLAFIPLIPCFVVGAYAKEIGYFLGSSTVHPRVRREPQGAIVDKLHILIYYCLKPLVWLADKAFTSEKAIGGVPIHRLFKGLVLVAVVGGGYSACAAFLISRTFLVVEAFLALPHAPDKVFVQPTWTMYFPHLG
ncbi:hypothetical protein NLU13_9733 [Sarocladium strictum]|uniref:Uncharacterized protein n=1 Tax=Sarocladium strictum TaxID=5046 RepID=A0AA39L4G9_SARSR|nr:hypothetical protein NLU13_9733 [Sarocladium strictum]